MKDGRVDEAPGFWLFLFRAELLGPLWRQARVAVAVSAPVSAAYQRAVESCRVELAPVIARWEDETARRRTAWTQELQRFYRQCLTEEVGGLGRLFHRVAVLEVRVNLAKKADARRQFRRELRRWEDELAGQLGGKEARAGGLAADLARRQQELAARAEGVVRVELVGFRPLSAGTAVRGPAAGKE